MQKRLSTSLPVVWASVGRRRPWGGASRGFTLIEAMILMVILSVVAVAAGVSLGALAKVPEQNDNILAINSQIVNCMEQMKATAASNFAGLGAEATSLSNASPGLLINGNYYPCTVTAAQANPDGTGNKTDFYQITVTVGTQSMTTYVLSP